SPQPKTISWDDPDIANPSPASSPSPTLEPPINLSATESEASLVHDESSGSLHQDLEAELAQTLPATPPQSNDVQNTDTPTQTYSYSPPSHNVEETVPPQPMSPPGSPSVQSEGYVPAFKRGGEELNTSQFVTAPT